MKSSTSFLVLILAVATQSILGQGNQDPIYFVNSVEVDFSKVHINTLNIDSIRVDKENFENGAIYIYTKKQCNFISIEKVVENHVDNAIMDKTLLFRINGTLVEDINGVLIDDSFKPLTDQAKRDPFQVCKNLYANH